MVSDRLKDIIFKKLYKELSKVEIIPYKDSVYFIDRDNEYWYFEYEKKGKLWWRYNFFLNFFVLFSLEPHEYEKVMGEWVEEVLNCKVNTTTKYHGQQEQQVEEVLNCKVITTNSFQAGLVFEAEEVLNHKVDVTMARITDRSTEVEEVLNLEPIL